MVITMVHFGTTKWVCTFSTFQIGNSRGAHLLTRRFASDPSATRRATFCQSLSDFMPARTAFISRCALFAGDIGDAGGKLLPVPDKKAIVNTQRRRVLGVVSRDYRLVSNRDALALAAVGDGRQGAGEVSGDDHRASRT